MIKARKCAAFTLAAIVCHGVLATLAQSPQIATRFPPRTLADALREHGINDLSEESLTAALANSDPEVRSVSANKLAEAGYADAIPAIESALSREQDAGAQVGIAEALWVLHDQKGVQHLQTMCMDSSLPFQALISTVRALKLTNSPEGMCAQALLSAMSHEKEAGVVAMAASLLPSIYRDSPPDQGKRIVYMLTSLLLDQKQEAIVRMMCSQALAQIAAPESATAIREAISHEQDPSNRSFFESSLKSLGKNQ